MECKKITELLPDFLAGYLDSKTREHIAAHIEECAKCKLEIEQFEMTWAKLEQLPEEEPGPAVKERFYSMLEAYQQGLEHNRQPRLSWHEKLGQLFDAVWPKQPAFQMGIALVFLVFGVFAGLFVDVSKFSNGEIAEMKKEMQDMRKMVTLSLLDQSSAIERLQGLSMSSNIENPDEEFLSIILYLLNSDTNVNVRLAAVEAMRSFGDNQWVRTELVKSLASQSSPLVQVGLIDLMVDLNEQNSLEVLREMANNQYTNDTVKQRAKWGIQQIL